MNDKNINLIESLIENNSIVLSVSANSWEIAVTKALKPLVDSKAIEEKYIKATIASTKKYGPYYIISDNVAMPHARPEDGVNKSAFSLIVLNKPVLFNNDTRAIKILIALAATTSDIHVSVALPQVVAIFEGQETIKKILNSKTKKEVITILKNVNFNKYLKKESHE